MNKLLTLSIIAFFSVFCLQACSKEDDDQDEFLKEYNLPRGVTKPTQCWQYEENVAKNALIAGFLNGDMWFAAYNDRKEQIFEYTAPMIQGFSQKFYLEFGEVEERNIDQIVLANFIMKNDGLILLVNYGGPSEIISTIGGKEKRIYYNRYDNSVISLKNWNNEYFITLGYKNHFLLDNNCNEIKKIPLDDYLINKLIPIDNISGLDVSYPSVSLVNITNGDYIWNYRHKEYSEEFIIKNKLININGDIINFTFDIVYRNGDKERESFKLNIEDGSLIE
ncbi:hypothetical protein NE636_00080 [Bacteroides thetaiotaomicron]|jgi:hypothetical protein|uniref:Lipoprotein n=3 Tax=Bacteroides thetaiotaomicron TaxID=818 RepID=A0AAW4Z4R6_BACT4|nr:MULTISPECIES: hypothetical protein [Bacteroides]MBV4310920.1 hypothetical protein [Bacteroides thetaiotaomicron]MBV4328125.1 hypothetical protein [Bacteroides thetaiotaomicron]MCB7382996.1 hypothetical protein [Bacteroides thetaiotaomicron]MCE9237774.1 hypothetical protein [Bacteroides thetaiotaomicron]MCE9266975.1 hypothetical protein [Bacteroides thetaiotaomicron]